MSQKKPPNRSKGIVVSRPWEHSGAVCIQHGGEICSQGSGWIRSATRHGKRLEQPIDLCLIFKRRSQQNVKKGRSPTAQKPVARKNERQEILFARTQHQSRQEEKRAIAVSWYSSGYDPTQPVSLCHSQIMRLGDRLYHQLHRHYSPRVSKTSITDIPQVACGLAAGSPEFAI